MCASPSISQRGVMLAAILLAGVVQAEQAAPRKPGLYDGAVGVKLEEIAEQSVTRVNPETMENAPWPLVKARIEQMTGMQVWVDETALTDYGIVLDRETIIPLWPAGETLAQLTNQLSEMKGTRLVWLVHERLATLTTEEKSYENYVTRQYPIGDLLYEGSHQPIMNLLLSETSGPWEVDEPGTGTISPLGNLLFVRQTHRVHQEVAETLAALRRDEPVVLTNSSKEDLRIRRLLEEKHISFEFPDNTLKEFVDWLEIETGSKFRLDEQSLTDAGLDAETRLEARAVKLPLFVALQMSLTNINGTELTIHVCDNECRIMTAEKANEKYETVLYRMGVWGITAAKIDEFAAMIESETSGPWDAEEPGTGNLFWLPGRNILAVRQTQRVHREILEILRGLRPTPTVTHPTIPRPVAAAIAMATSPDEPTIQVNTARPAPSRVGPLAQSIRQSFAVSTWETIADYAPLLLALLLGCATGYVCRH